MRDHTASKEPRAIAHEMRGTSTGGERHPAEDVRQEPKVLPGQIDLFGRVHEPPARNGYRRRRRPPDG